MFENDEQQRVLGYSHPMLGLPGVTPESLRAMGVPADPAERMLRRLVEKQGLSVEAAVAQMIACKHPGHHEWDDVMGGGSAWECLYCGFSQYLPDEFWNVGKNTDHEDWPEKVRAIAREMYPEISKG